MNDSTLSVGADVHLKDIVLRAVDQRDGRQVIEPFSVTNNLSGAQSAAATMAQTATRLGYDCIQIGYEATGMLWIPFHHFLSTPPLLEPFELQLVCFNPKLVANFKDALVLRRPKNDDRDTLDVSARVRFGEWPDSYVPSPFWQGVRRSTGNFVSQNTRLARRRNRSSCWDLEQRPCIVPVTWYRSFDCQRTT